jgi:hypothetical protein
MNDRKDHADSTKLHRAEDERRHDGSDKHAMTKEPREYPEVPGAREYRDRNHPHQHSTEGGTERAENSGQRVRQMEPNSTTGRSHIVAMLVESCRTVQGANL